MNFRLPRRPLRGSARAWRLRELEGGNWILRDLRIVEVNYYVPFSHGEQSLRC
jgi:hypothetical protein